ncbi:hypothetical protein [Vitiosangium sp. GDMCC 1.1324]|uniref:hypothetical protein n=1 Tax=Vitiosangium sp. (strain GDMCC 1.1324) TaxID=2138576 RepID=UPI000D3CD9EB|nr:hypothetical protein [Vitiosangium sp. GDMCC 1.1324]PTL77019.1 hypothetical protein DAT35_46075 [Vitiosangium sp. GDMCC 1.1324]
MSSAKIAIKSLTSSDLSFFKVHLKLSKQKAINLNSDVFIDRFYPGLKGIYDPVFFPLTIIGPGGRAAHRLARKALRSPGAKNWRLNGEIIHDPDGEPGRYDGLAADDFAVISFEGNERPKALSLVLVSANDDAKLRAAIASFFEFAGRSTMVEVSETIIADLRAATIDAYAAGEHPFDALVFRDTVEEVLFGNSAPTPVGTTPSGRSVAMSPHELRQQLLAAEETGQLGEELFGNWLVSKGHDEDDFEWVSLTHARSAFDYEVHAARWLDTTPHVFVDVKTTRGSFERPIHMSIAELRFAATTENYRIARLYDLASSKPKLRILNGIQPFAQAIVGSLGSLPAGVVADSVQIKPDVFPIELDDQNL